MNNQYPQKGGSTITAEERQDRAGVCEGLYSSMIKRFLLNSSVLFARLRLQIRSCNHHEVTSIGM